MKVILVEVVKKKKISIKEVKESMTLDKIEFQERILVAEALSLTNLLKIHS